MHTINILNKNFGSNYECQGQGKENKPQPHTNIFSAYEFASGGGIQLLNEFTFDILHIVHILFW